MVWFKIALVAFASIPVLNNFVFRVENLEELKVEVRDRLITIQTNLNEGEFDAAVTNCDNFDSTYSGRKDEFSQVGVQTVLMWKGNAFRMQQDYLQAIKAYQTLEQRYPESPFTEHNYQAIAGSYFDQALLQPDLRDKRKYFTKAIQYYEKIVLNRPKTRDFPAYANRDLTPKKYEIMSTIYLDNVLIEIGRCYLRMEQAEKAREYFRMVVEFFEGSDSQDDAQKYIGDSYLKQSRTLEEKLQKVSDPEERKNIEYDIQKYNKMALRTFQDFVNIYGQSEYRPDVMISMGELYIRSGNEARGVDVFTNAINAIKVPEEQAKVQIKIGNYYYNAGQYQKAIDAYQKVVKNFPESKIAANAQYLTGTSYEMLGDQEQAFAAYNNVCDYYKTSKFYAPAAYKLGAKLVNQEEYKEALQYFTMGITLYPNSPVADLTQYQIGFCYYKLQDYRKAITEFQILYSEHPDSRRVEEAHYQIGLCYNELDEKDKARNSFLNIRKNRELIMAANEVMGTDATNPDDQINTWQQRLADEEEPEAQSVIYMNIGRIYAENKQEYESALEYFRKALEASTDPVKHLALRSHIANAYFSLAQYDSARAIFQSLKDNEEAEEDMRLQSEFKIYDAYRKEGQYETARDGFIAFVEKNEFHQLAAYAQFMNGLCEAELKNYDAAIEAYAVVIDKYAESDVADDAGLATGNAYKSDGRIEEAISWWEDFLGKHPECDARTQMYYQLGDAYRQHRDDCSAAIDYYKKVYDEFPDDYLYSASAYQAGMCFVKLKDEETAKFTLQLVKKGDTQLYQAARAEIGRIMSKSDPEGAVTEYEEIEREATEDGIKAMARLGIGDIYSGRKKFKDAVESYLIVLEQYLNIEDNLKSGTYIKLIDAYNNLGRFRDVIKYSEQMIEAYPDGEYTINAVYFKANAYYSLKQYRTAMQVFDQVITDGSSPSLAEISLYQKAECLLFQDKQLPAVAAYAAFQEKYPRSSYFALSLYQQGNAYWALEDYPKAKIKYKQVVDNHPNFSELDMAMAFLGFCYNEAGDWQTAKKYYQRVIKRNRKKAAVTFAKEQLEKINVTH